MSERGEYRRPPSDVDNMISLRVDNLPYRTHQEDLKPLFEKYGDVGDIYIPSERGTGRSRGFAFVRYYDRRDAEVVIKRGESGSREPSQHLPVKSFSAISVRSYR